MVKDKHSQEFLEQSQLQEQDKELAQFKHNIKMEALAYERETNRLFHEWSLERGRIQRAEQKKLWREKEQMRHYPRG